jgi:hypothetical protein
MVQYSNASFGSRYSVGDYRMAGFGGFTNEQSQSTIHSVLYRIAVPFSSANFGIKNGAHVAWLSHHDLALEARSSMMVVKGLDQPVQVRCCGHDHKHVKYLMRATPDIKGAR